MRHIGVGVMALALGVGAACAADFTWLGSPASASWNETDTNWTGAGSVWINADTNNAVLGTSSTRGLSAGAVVVSNLTFSADGYQIGNGSMDIAGTVSVGASQTALLTAQILHSNTNRVFVKSGSGTLVMCPATSNVIASFRAVQGTWLQTGGTTYVSKASSLPESGPAFWVSGGTLVVGGGVFKTLGVPYARVSEYGSLLVTNGVCDLSSNGELLNAFNSPGSTTVGGSGVLVLDRMRIVKNQVGANYSFVNINTGGTIRVNEFWFEATDVNRKATVNLNGGTIVAKDSATTRNMLGTYEANWTNILVNVLPGGAIFDNNGCNFTVIAKLRGSANDGGLTKLNNGALYLYGTNSYNGATVLKGGTLTIYDNQNLGAVPASPATNLVFGGTATLQSSGNHALSANRSIWITNGVTATFDTQSYTQSVYGVVTCADTNSAFIKVGNGTLVLDSGAAAVNRFGTLQNSAGMTIIVGGTNYVTCPNSVQNAPGLRVCGGTLLVAGGLLKTTAAMFVNVDGGHLLVTNGVVDATSCTEWLNGIGGNGFGYTTVRGNGVIVANTVRITQNTGDPTNTVVTVKTGGTLRLTNFTIDIFSFTWEQRGMLVLDGGTVEARQSTDTFLGTTTTFVGNSNDRWLTNILVRVREGGAVFNTAGYNISIKQPLLTDVAADGGLIKRGAGTLTLLNTNGYSGVTSVEAGTLKLGTKNALWPAGSASVSSGAVFDVNGVVQSLAGLGGSGTVTNNASLSVAETVAPGGTNAVGTLLLSTPCPLSGTFRATVSRDGNCGQLRVNGNLDLSGLTLSVANSGSLNKDKLYVVASYKGVLTGTFASATLPYRWLVHYDEAHNRVYLSYTRGTLLTLF
jgi:autotransporter-associated beta strand protein